MFSFRRKISYSLIIKLSFLVLISVALLSFRAETLSWDRAVLGLAIAWVGLLPGVIFFETPHEKRPPFPFMPMVGLFYAIFFGLSAFFAAYLRNNDAGMIQFFGVSFLKEISVHAQVLALIGTAVMLSVWALSKSILISRVPGFSAPDKYPEWRLIALIWGLVIGNLLYIHVPLVRSLPSIGQLLQPAGFVGFALILALYYQARLSRWQLLAYFGIAFPLWTVGLLATSSLTPLILIGGLWIAAHLYFRQFLPWKWLMATGLILVVSYPIMSGYRTLSNQIKEDRAGINDHRRLPDHLRPQNLNEKLALIKSAIEHILEIDNNALYERSTGIFRRTGLIFAFSKVVEETPKNVPYWEGETYRPMVTSWIPRVLWKNKPEEKSGYAFGVRYSLIGEKDKHMSYNLPWITELYVNFGRVGVVVGMALIGLFLAVLECIFNKRKMKVVEFGVGSAILIPLTFQESNFTLMTGSLLPLALCLWVYFSLGLGFRTKQT